MLEEEEGGSNACHYAELALFFVLWWTVAVILVAVIKNTVSNPDMAFPFPLLLSFLTNGGTGLLALGWMQIQRGLMYSHLAYVVGLPTSQCIRCFFRGALHFRPRLGLKDFLQGLVPIGLFLGLEIGLTNTALQLLSISDRTMVHACGPAAVLLFARLFGLERLTLEIQLVLLLVVSGGLISAASAMQSTEGASTLGFILEAGALCMQGLRWCVTQRLLQTGHKLVPEEEDRSDVLRMIWGRTLHPDPHKEPLCAAMYPAAGHVKPIVEDMQHNAPRPGKTPGGGHERADRGYFAAMYPDKAHVQKVVDRESQQHLLRAESAPSPTRMGSHIDPAEKARIGSRVAHVSKIEIAAYVNPITASVCLILSIIFEPEAFARPAIGWDALLCTVGFLSGCVLLSMVLELKLVQLTSAFALSLAGVVHNILIVVAGVIVFGDVLTPTGVAGFVITNVGVAFYAQHKHRAKD